MGSCSNREYTREEKLSKYAKEVMNANKSQTHWQNNYEEFQCTIGAKIRGELGIKKGNDFIRAIKESTDNN